MAETVGLLLETLLENQYYFIWVCEQAQMSTCFIMYDEPFIRFIELNWE